jgi:hypothetical protein
MRNSRLFLTLLLLMASAQGAFAATIWLKVSINNANIICANSKSSNPASPNDPTFHPIAYGGIDSSGNFTLKISNPSDGVVSPAGGKSGNACTAFPQTGLSTSETPILFSGSMTSATPTIYEWRPGTTSTGSQLYCQNEGANLEGVSGTLTSQDGNYSVNMAFSLTSQGCDFNSQSQIGTGNAVYARSYTLTKLSDSSTVAAGSYYLFNLATIPEPGSLYLLAAGAVALFSLGLIRRRKTA